LSQVSPIVPSKETILLISRETEDGEEPLTRDATAGDDDEVFAFPASFAQQRLWFLDRVDPGTAVYNIPQAFRLEGPLRIDLVARALQEIVRRHEALRTTFGSTDGTPLQLVASSRVVDLPTIDLRHLPDDQRLIEAQRLADQDAREPFSLEKGPLLRASMLVLGAEDHVLLFNVHHIVCDGWSLALLFHEMSEIYRAFAADRPSPLPDIPIQYPDYTLWQRDWLQGEELERQLGYWRDRLGGELPVLELPGDRGRPPLQTFRGGWLKFHLSKELTDGVAALARREGISLYMTLLAAFKVLLHRLSGQGEILVGSPIANRDRAEIENAIGFYTNTVVFRTDLQGGPTFKAVLGRIKENALGVYANQDVPLEQVVNAVRPDRGAGHNPLFQVMFGFQKAPDAALALDGVTVTPLVVHSGTSKFDLLLEMQEIAAGMQCFLEYSRDLFDDATATRFIEHFRTLIEGVVRSPERSIDELPLLTDAERQRILVDWNATRAEYPEASCLHELVAAQAALTPQSIAVEYEAERLTYAELDGRADLLARYLRTLGVGPDVMVGVFLDRSLDLLVALLGILKAGGAYLPLDPAFPQDRVAYMVADAQAPVILTQERLVESLPVHNALQIVLDTEWHRIARGVTTSGELPDLPPGPENLAYMIYTSGSTGKPKGVQIPHRAVVNFLTSMLREPGFTATDKLLAVTTLSFDIAGLELYLPLLVGGTVVLASRDLATDGPALLAKITTAGVTVMQATPATWRMLLEAGWQGPTALTILCGGEAWPADLATQLLARSARLWNMYGPTETTIWSTCFQVTDESTLLIGGPIANTQTYVLDGKLEPVPIGVTGELYIGGDGVARGYFNRPELTEEKFIPDPFRQEPGARLYRTGDLARYLPSGLLQFLRRGDNQVKVRGFRIELGEIEAVLAQHPAIRQPVVVVKEDSSGDKRIVAYLVYRSEQTPLPAGAHAASIPEPIRAPTSSELRKFLRGLLPDYMVPHLFMDLEVMPLTQNGKIDRRALPDPFQESSAPAEEYAAPRTPMEVFVADLWRELLHVERVGLRDNFFDLGGHSLLSMQVAHRIEQKIGRRLNPRSMVFQNLEQIAAECGDDGAGSAAKPVDVASRPEASKVAVPERAAVATGRPPPPVEPAKPLTTRLFAALKSKMFRS
jgi:amino acid adenylation domain-containing protein